jgi:sporulation protein YabP
MNDIVSSGSKPKHSFSSSAREGMNISGVCDVISFDENGVALRTDCGEMAIEGEGLHITVLNITDGNVVIEGRINGLYYYESRPAVKKGLFGKRQE